MRIHVFLGVLHIRSAIAGGVKPMPKHHQMVHLLQGVPANGSPSLYSNWRDESLNRNLANIAGAAYAAVWERRIFISYLHWRGLRGAEDWV